MYRKRILIDKYTSLKKILAIISACKRECRIHITNNLHTIIKEHLRNNNYVTRTEFDSRNKKNAFEYIHFEHTNSKCCLVTHVIKNAVYQYLYYIEIN